MNTNNPAEVKIALLVKGMQMDDNITNELGTKYQEKIYSYSLTDWTTKKIMLPSDIKLGEDIFVGFRLNNNSEWKITKLNNEKILLKNNKKIAKIDFISRPKYYDLETTKGNKLQTIGVSCGNHGVSFFINNYCEYFRYDENCKFCSLVPTQKKFSDTLKKKSVSDVGEAIDSILELGCPLDFIQFSGGSFYNHDFEAEMYIPHIKKVHEALKKENLDGVIPIHLTCMPPNNLSLIDAWKDAGLNTVSFDLECPTEEYFNKYCPGKANSKGFDGMKNSLNYASKILGEENVYSILIMGIEPKESFIEGVEELLKDGITPTLNIYHHDPLSASKMDVGEPDINELIETTYNIADLFAKYNALPGKLGCAHYDIGHEIRKGYFKNVRQTQNEQVF